MSTVVITYDGSPIQQHVVFANARFESSVNGAPGPAKFRVRDLDLDASYPIGKSVTLTIDGELKWSGISTIAKRVYIFPALNLAESGMQNFWDIECTDWNILFSKRFVFDQSVPENTRGTLFPVGTADDAAIADLVANFLDLTGDGIDTSSLVQNVGDITIGQEGRAWAAADAWGRAMSVIAALPGAIFYIDPDKNLVYCDVDTPDAPFGLSDIPDGTHRGYREMELLKDGTGLANDVLGWGIGYGSQVPVFKRLQDATSLFEHGLWQRGQTYFGVYTQSTLDGNVSSILNGSPENLRGSKDDKVGVTLVTYEPGLRVAQKVPFVSNAFAFSDVIPIRKMLVTFDAPDTPKYELTLSHDIDVPYSIIDNYFLGSSWRIKPPKFNLCPTGFIPDGNGNCIKPPLFPPGGGGCGPGELVVTTECEDVLDDDWEIGTDESNQDVNPNSFEIPPGFSTASLILTPNNSSPPTPFDNLFNRSAVGAVLTTPWVGSSSTLTEIEIDIRLPNPTGDEVCEFRVPFTNGATEIMSTTFYYNLFSINHIPRVAFGIIGSSVDLSLDWRGELVHIKWRIQSFTTKAKVWLHGTIEPDWQGDFGNAFDGSVVALADQIVVEDFAAYTQSEYRTTIESISVCQTGYLTNEYIGSAYTVNELFVTKDDVPAIPTDYPGLAAWRYSLPAYVQSNPGLGTITFAGTVDPDAVVLMCTLVVESSGHFSGPGLDEPHGGFNLNTLLTITTERPTILRFTVNETFPVGWALGVMNGATEDLFFNNPTPGEYLVALPQLDTWYLYAWSSADTYDPDLAIDVDYEVWVGGSVVGGAVLDTWVAEIPVLAGDTVTLLAPFLIGSTQVWVDGLRQRLGIDYTEGGPAGTITFDEAPDAGASIRVVYYSLP